MSDQFDPPVGQAQSVAPLLRRVLAPNPSPMTFRGTNTYLLGDRELAVIDPGPASQHHLSAILAAVGPTQKISHIFVTHSHKDHSPLAPALSQATGAPVFAFGPARAGRSEAMRRLAAAGLEDGGEGVDTTFKPDHSVADGTRIATCDWQLEVIHTPGHLGNHICLQWNDCCFTGDHVMGWASSLVSPPDGDLTDFMESCSRLAEKQWKSFFPGHGDVILNPASRLQWLISHRRARESAILDALAQNALTAAELTALIYTDTPKALFLAAERNVLAHLVDLYGKSKVTPRSTLNAASVFTRCDR